MQREELFSFTMDVQYTFIMEMTAMFDVELIHVANFV